MGKRRTILVGGLAVIAIVAGTVAVRTATFAPKDIADGSGVALAAVPVYDLAAAVEHLSAAAQIPTISHQDAADNDIAEWDRLHAWLAATYPATHEAMARRSEEHTSELQSLMRISYAVFCLKKKKKN